ncbi:MAG: hypothetical protein C4567_09395 [Deltaproteobacteria bacterium]|nr:MAG: hypothetical protein C4567_09395 [Deltaproteobacteria bacterium]
MLAIIFNNNKILLDFRMHPKQSLGPIPVPKRSLGTRMEKVGCVLRTINHASKIDGRLAPKPPQPELYLLLITDH